MHALLISSIVDASNCCYLQINFSMGFNDKVSKIMKLGDYMRFQQYKTGCFLPSHGCDSLKGEYRSTCFIDFGEIGLLGLLVSVFPRVHHRRLSACTCVPHGDGNSMGGPHLFGFGV